MIKLYKFNGNDWEFFDYGVRSKVDAYCSQGFLIIY